MAKIRSSRKRQFKILKPFQTDDRKLQNLKLYIGEQSLNANESENHINLNGGLKRKKPQKTNSDHFEMYCLDTSDSATDNCKDLSSRVNEASFDNGNDQMDSNMLNNSLRNVYLNSVKIGNVSLDPKDTASDLSSNPLMPIPCGDGNKLDESCSLKNTKKSKNTSGIGNRRLNVIVAKTKKTPNIPIQQCSIKFSDIGGFDDTQSKIIRHSRYFTYPNYHNIMGVKNPRHGILLHGPSGCGKTLIAHAIAGELQLPFIEVSAANVLSGALGEIRDLFEHAVSYAPSILFIEEIDAIAPKRETVQGKMENQIVIQLLECMHELSGKQVMVIGATNRHHLLDPALPKCFEREIHIGIPNEAARLQILKLVCTDLKRSADFTLEWLARNTPGYNGTDLRAITKDASDIALELAVQNVICGSVSLETANPREDAIKALPSSAPLCLANEPLLDDEQQNNIYIEIQDFEASLQNYVPSTKQEGFSAIPEETWDGVGALENVRSLLQTAILWPIKYQNVYKTSNIRSPMGVLLYGPKGCGKTSVAKAVANECCINFLSVKGTELLSKYVGDSERAVRECFQRARDAAPCVILTKSTLCAHQGQVLMKVLLQTGLSPHS